MDLTDPFRIANPLKRDYTYNPFGNTRNNRSRIDFFCISNQLIEKICKIDNSRVTLCDLFDHKMVTLGLGKEPTRVTTASLSNRFLDDKILKLAVRASTIKTHLEYHDPNASEEAVQLLSNREREQTHQIDLGIKRYIKLEYNQAIDPSELNKNLAAAALSTVEMLLNDMQELSFFENQPKNITKSFFFETLVREIKKTGLWVQKKLFGIKKVQLLELEKVLDRLKQNYDDNIFEVVATEKKIEKIRNLDLQNKLRDMKIFDCLSAERSSPHFLNIAKKQTALLV